MIIDTVASYLEKRDFGNRHPYDDENDKARNRASEPLCCQFDPYTFDQKLDSGRGWYNLILLYPDVLCDVLFSLVYKTL